ncbi:protein of unknown function [Modicisalibacter muralis]|uniref:YjiS-like domain-containing protein n=1 Tax=Modicisalibacter muralis TaxID=119000 RepID=A0A1G9PVQ5_9GAMM|nr:DUF1127 domain-containing protein [Halomonas muralis]SDM02872.1 protein of unknown function [Halomonas muralis]
MPLSTLFRRTLETLSEMRHRQRNVSALAHLDAHLLKDIGLHVEQGFVRPLYPEDDTATASKPQPAHDSPQMTESVAHPEKLCPSCGATLA